jgi:hypothetical protein
MTCRQEIQAAINTSVVGSVPVIDRKVVVPIAAERTARFVGLTVANDVQAWSVSFEISGHTRFEWLASVTHSNIAKFASYRIVQNRVHYILFRAHDVDPRQVRQSSATWMFRPESPVAFD